MRLAGEALLAGSELDVQVEGGRVLLVGIVFTRSARERAGRVAGQTPDVSEVVNRLELASRGERPTVADDDLASDVTYLLGAELEAVQAGDDPLVGWRVDGGHWEIVVVVEDRDVTLDGSVPARRDVRRAVETAWRVPGVRRVQADLQIVGDRKTPPLYVGGESAE